MGMHTSFRVSICCLSSADHSLCYTSSRHTPYRNPLPNKASLFVAGETQGCVRMMLWEWVKSIEQPVTAQYEVCLLPPLSVTYANRLSGRGGCVFSGVGLWESEGANPECFTGEERTIQSPAPPKSPPHHYNSLHATSQDKDVVFSLCIKVPSHPTPLYTHKHFNAEHLFLYTHIPLMRRHDKIPRSHLPWTPHKTDKLFSTLITKIFKLIWHLIGIPHLQSKV